MINRKGNETMSESLSPPPSNLVLLDIHEVNKRVGLSTSTIYKRIRAKEFPAPVSLGTRTVRWVESEINGWIADKMAAARIIPAQHGKAA